MKVVVTVPNDYLGNVTGDLISRRGMIINTDDQRQVVKLVTAEVPLDKLFGYTTSLRGMSQGWASSTMEFLEYRQMPRSLMDEVLAEQAGREEVRPRAARKNGNGRHQGPLIVGRPFKSAPLARRAPAILAIQGQGCRAAFTAWSMPASELR